VKDQLSILQKKVADDIYNTKKKGGKIIIVGGPAIVHTGASDSVAELIKLGYIDGVLAGNALAVHDIEYATLGTSLGMNVQDATELPDPGIEPTSPAAPVLAGGLLTTEPPGKPFVATCGI